MIHLLPPNPPPHFPLPGHFLTAHKTIPFLIWLTVIQLIYLGSSSPVHRPCDEPHEYIKAQLVVKTSALPIRVAIFNGLSISRLNLHFPTQTICVLLPIIYTYIVLTRTAPFAARLLKSQQIHLPPHSMASNRWWTGRGSSTPQGEIPVMCVSPLRMTKWNGQQCWVVKLT